MLLRLATIIFIILFYFPKASFSEERKLNIYNWSNFISQDTIKKFEKNYHIKVKYDVYDSDHTLDAKLYIGNIGYDLVVPSTYPFLLRQSKIGIYQRINKSKLKNYKNLDPNILNIMKKHGNTDKYGIPWMWGTVGIGYNTDKFNQIFPGEIPNSLEYVFNEKYLKSLQKCGVMFMDAPNEILPMAFHYLGFDPNSEDDKELEKVKELLLKIRPYISQFHSSKYIDDLTNNDICLAVGFSGDIIQARERGKENKTANIEYVIPKEGTQIWIDSFAIPREAKNIQEVYQFLDFLLEPQVAAKNTNILGFANANKYSKSYIYPHILNNKSIYLNEDLISKLYIINPLSQEAEKKRNRLWIQILSNK